MKKLILFFLVLSANAFAGNMDCSVVYDEYDALMDRNFLIRPLSYVDGHTNIVSRSTYNGSIKGEFKLKKERKGLGIAVFRTNKNTYGRFLYTWGAPFRNGQPSLILKDIVKYKRVYDGFGKTVRSKVVIPSSYTLDLDTFQLAQGQKSDLWFENVNGTRMNIRAKNGAKIIFLTESQCR